MSNKNAIKKKSQSDELTAGSIFDRIRAKVVNMRESSGHKSFGLSRKYQVVKDNEQVTGGFRLLQQSVGFYVQNRRLFLPLSLIYLVALWLVIGLPDQQAYSEFKSVITQSLEGSILNVVGVSSLFVGVLGGLAGVERSDLQQFLSALISLIFWLVFIWVIRQLQAGNEVTVRQALYNASTPLVALFVLVFIIALQFIPAAIGFFVLVYAFSPDVYGAGGVEAMLFSIGAFLLIILTIYWLLQSLFAAIIVTLPNMYPLAALSSAKDLVANRRLLVLRRLATPALLILLAWTLVLVLAIVIDAVITRGFIPIVSLSTDLLAAFTLPIVIIYLYRLYRELL